MNANKFQEELFSLMKDTMPNELEKIETMAEFAKVSSNYKMRVENLEDQLAEAVVGLKLLGINLESAMENIVEIAKLENQVAKKLRS